MYDKLDHVICQCTFPVQLSLFEKKSSLHLSVKTIAHVDRLSLLEAKKLRAYVIASISFVKLEVVTLEAALAVFQLCTQRSDGNIPQ